MLGRQGGYEIQVSARLKVVFACIVLLYMGGGGRIAVCCYFGSNNNNDDDRYTQILAVVGGLCKDGHGIEERKAMRAASFPPFME